MKLSDYIKQVETEVEVIESYYVTFTGLGCFQDVGIGLFEFWGSKGNDVNYIPVVEDITWNKKIHTDAQNILINIFLETNKESIEASLLEEFYSYYSEL